jgi:hypothetical protein
LDDRSICCKRFEYVIPIHNIPLGADKSQHFVDNMAKNFKICKQIFALPTAEKSAKLFLLQAKMLWESTPEHPFLFPWKKEM